jgi:hypothetical protein
LASHLSERLIRCQLELEKSQPAERLLRHGGIQLEDEILALPDLSVTEERSSTCERKAGIGGRSGYNEKKKKKKKSEKFDALKSRVYEPAGEWM